MTENQSPNVNQSPNDEDFIVVDDPIAQINDMLKARERGEMTDREALDFITSAIADHLADLNRETEPVGGVIIVPPGRGIEVGDALQAAAREQMEQVSLCPACGQPIDYCQGHGEFGDPYGRLILDHHRAGDHSGCVINCEEES